MTTEAAQRVDYVCSLVMFVAERYGVSAADVMSRSRVAPVADARGLVMAHLRRQEWSLVEIGLCFDRDHSTVHHMVTKLERRARSDRAVRDILDAMPLFIPPATEDTRDAVLYARLEWLLAAAVAIKAELERRLAIKSIPTRVAS